jgi:hypothetical protein
MRMTIPAPERRLNQPDVAPRVAPQRLGNGDPPPVTAGSGSGASAAHLPPVARAPKQAQRTEPEIDFAKLDDAYQALVDAMRSGFPELRVPAQLQFDIVVDAEISKGVRKSEDGIYHPDDLNRRSELLMREIAKEQNPVKKFAFEISLRDVREERAIKNLIGLNRAIGAGNITLSQSGRMIADAARWITEPDPNEEMTKADDRTKAEGQFERLYSTIKESADKNTRKDVLAAVVAKCADKLMFGVYKPAKADLQKLQDMIGTGNSAANMVIILYGAHKA